MLLIDHRNLETHLLMLRRRGISPVVARALLGQVAGLSNSLYFDVIRGSGKLYYWHIINSRSTEVPADAATWTNYSLVKIVQYLRS